MIAAIITVACSFLALPLGPWFDRGGHGWARKYRSAVMAAGYFIFSIFTGIGALTSSIWSIVVLQSVKNAFGGAGEAIEVTAMAESYPVERRGFALGIQHTAYPWGTLIASFVTSAILATFGPENWRYVFLLIPLAMIPIWIGYWLFATKKRYQKFERDTEDAGLTKPLTGSDDETHRAAPGAMGRALRNPNIIVPSIASMLGIAVYAGSASGSRSTSPSSATTVSPKQPPTPRCSPSPVESGRSCGARSRTGSVASSPGSLPSPGSPSASFCSNTLARV